MLDIDPDLVDFVTPLEDSLVKDARAYARAQDRKLDSTEAAPRFAIDTRIVHPVFGAGTVLGLDADRGAYEILFDNMDTSRSLSFKANLSPG